MLKIVLFSGGTGSVALQNGISQLYGSDTIQLDIIVNAYDNGKSTGSCRRVFHNQILGPSDVRKNQLVQFSIQHKHELCDTTNRFYRLNHLFDIRLSAPDPMSYYHLARTQLDAYHDIFDTKTQDYLAGLLDYFFFEKDESGNSQLRKTVIGEVFKDFSLSNIFYAACAAMNGNSLEAASDKMAEILEIKNNVHLISDISLILKAETQSGKVIEDEGDIVTWDNPNDKIIRAILCKGEQEYLPSINEGSHNAIHSVEKLVLDADIIIFSSGTQWSSLIPSYMHRGVKALIQRAHAKKYLVMNNIEDHDSFGVGAEEICGILDRYLDMSEITVVLNENASPSMRSVSSQYHSIRGKLGECGCKSHIPGELAGAIMKDYYKEALACPAQFFDLDGTLWNENGTDSEKTIGRDNLNLFHGKILSGNSVEHIVHVLTDNAPSEKVIEVFADYGNSYFTTDDPDHIEYLSDKYFLDDAVYQEIDAQDEFSGKAKMRGGTVITIKPLKDRERLVGLLNERLANRRESAIGNLAGRTSIDVTHADYSKAAMLKLILDKYKISRDQALFVGNELQSGSEKGITGIGITTLHVNDVYECNVYLRTRNLTEKTNGEFLNYNKRSDDRAAVTCFSCI